ncbi:hypothetical protein [[Leptolyngbya] sp. PCC 7376]|uniref:hypothetical protein n=1 Tax=[Leptolyngbya] sp. PCC 7376 TaxID=111781 RepID=UPI00135C17A1|nr:hypothetical protein [[Leptolyngbya] sp. PCC 7376]
MSAFYTFVSLLFLINPVDAKATQKSTFTVPIHRSMDYQDIRHQAEQLTNAYISLAFTQNLDIEALQLDVLGEKAVEIVPLFSIFITRTQWRESPHISDWVSYNQASFSLLQSDQPLIASAEENDVVSSSSRTTSINLVNFPAIDESFVIDEVDIDQLINDGFNPQVIIDDLD